MKITKGASRAQTIFKDSGGFGADNIPQKSQVSKKYSVPSERTNIGTNNVG
jgi:hypothetical protein